MLWTALLLTLAVGILGRGYWTPDEPREADVAWRMSWQDGKAVPLLAGEPFCEKPPLTYWMAGAAIRSWGGDTGGAAARVAPAWIARLPNLLYALITVLAVGSLARRNAGGIAGLAAAAAIGTCLLTYQVAIWLATDAPLLAAVAVALLGLYVGFYAVTDGERLRGYSVMHAALALGFLSKSAAGWMVPLLTLVALVVWERRWRELLRWELYVGLVLQAVIILTWVGFVYAGPDGAAHLKVFFWNNLAGRFAHVDAPQELQYTAAHRNSPGKYLIELPAYLWPWTLLVLAAVRCAWRRRGANSSATATAGAAVDQRRPVRFASATFVPALCMLSVAATARNIYLAPAFPGVALLLGWWVNRVSTLHDAWDQLALTATSALLLLATLVLAGAVAILGRDSWEVLGAHLPYFGVSAIGLAAGGVFAIAGWRRSRQGRMLAGLFAVLLAYSSLLVGPASQIYRQVDTWQNLGKIGRAIARDAGGRPLILFASDETTRALIDMYASPTAGFIPGPVDLEATARLNRRLEENPSSLVVSQLPTRTDLRKIRDIARVLGVEHRMPLSPPEADAAPSWAAASHIHIEHIYALPNGRRYALLAPDAGNR